MLSVILATRNRQDLINKQIFELNTAISLLEIPSEVIFFDDASDSPLYVHNANFKYLLLRSEINIGLIEARNIACKSASKSSNYLFFLDDDIFIYNFEKFLNSAINSINSGYDIVTLPYINLPTYKYEQLSTFTHIFDLGKGDDDVVYFFGGTSLFSTSTFTSLGGLEGIYFIYLEEEDFALRLYLNGGKMKMLYNESFIAIHDQAVGKNWDERKVFLLSNRFLFHYKFINNIIIRTIFDYIYIFIFLVKYRSITILKKSKNRFKDKKNKINKLNINTLTYLRFVIKRYFNI